MPGSRVLFAALLLVFFAGCGENTQQPTPGPDPAITNTTKSVPYGLHADISFKGDVSQFTEQAKIIVFMRKVNSRMPLAVEQFDVSQLPKRVSFTSNTPQTNIELVSRLSANGKVEKSDGDIEVITSVGMLEHPPRSFNISLGTGVNVTERVEGKTQKNITLHLRVSVSPAAKFPPGTGLRVIVKGDNNPSPIATRSLVLSALPTELTFTYSDATGLTHTLSSSNKLSISARLYQTGTQKPYDANRMYKSIEIDTANIPELVHLEIGG